jgi:hypothetical protein
VKRPILISAAALLLLAAGAAVRILSVSKAPAIGGKPGSPPAIPALDAASWARTSEGDFEEAVVDGPDRGGRLRIRAATRGTRDDTVKFTGARTVRKFPLGPGARVSGRLDWNRQVNGSYLSGSFILAPEATAANPLSGQNWFKVEYIGVPPGENGRLLIACRSSGRERYLADEGWPQLNRQGRKIGLQEIEIVVDDPGVRVFENGALVFETKERVILFDTSYLYLQMSTHSNYPPRELFFDKVRFPGGP